MKTKGLLVSAGVAGAIGSLLPLIVLVLLESGAFGVYKQAGVGILGLLSWPLWPLAIYLGMNNVSSLLGFTVIFLGYALLGAVIYRFVA